MKKIKIEKLTNLKKVINKLNAPIEINGEKIESPYDFTIKERNDIFNGCVAIYDRNENYTYNYCDYYGRDTIRPQLEEALEKDLGKEYYLEQEDSVIMFIAA